MSLFLRETDTHTHTKAHAQGRQTGRAPLVHLSKAHNGQGWARANARNWECNPYIH